MKCWLKISTMRASCCLVAMLLMGIIFPSTLGASPQDSKVPTHIPPRRSSQIHDGFGINSDLPRKPWLPWDRWWWTRMSGAGTK